MGANWLVADPSVEFKHVTTGLCVPRRSKYPTFLVLKQALVVVVHDINHSETIKTVVYIQDKKGMYGMDIATNCFTVI